MSKYYSNLRINMPQNSFYHLNNWIHDCNLQIRRRKRETTSFMGKHSVKIRPYTLWMFSCDLRNHLYCAECPPEAFLSNILLAGKDPNPHPSLLHHFVNSGAHGNKRIVNIKGNYWNNRKKCSGWYLDRPDNSGSFSTLKQCSTNCSPSLLFASCYRIEKRNSQKDIEYLSPPGAKWNSESRIQLLEKPQLDHSFLPEHSLTPSR